MRKIISYILLALMFCAPSYGAMTNGTLWEIRDTATTGNVNGAGFNPNATFGITDATTDANTANTDSPIVSSVTYNFVPADQGAWLYVKSGTSWTPGFYQITVVSSNKATLNAAVGAAVQLDPVSGMWGANTVAGCATVGTPTNGTIGVDYSQQDTADVNGLTNFGALGGATTLTSVSAPFRITHIGNIYHQTTTGVGGFGVVGWYEITAFTDTSNVVLDRTPDNGTASVGCTGYVGGAGRLNALEDAFFEQTPALSKVFIKKGTYTISANLSIVSTLSTQFLPSLVMGYKSLRGDVCNGGDRPLLAAAAFTLTFGPSQCLMNLRVTTTNTAGLSTGSSSFVWNCQGLNSSSANANRAALTSVLNVSNSEGVSQFGIGINLPNNTSAAIGCYAHDSVSGFNIAGTGASIIGSVVEGCFSNAVLVNTANANARILNNTFYGTEAKMGNGILSNSPTNATFTILNNIFYGFNAGVSNLQASTANTVSQYNNFFNNNTNAVNWLLGVNDLTLNPTFAGVSQITGTTGGTTGGTTVFGDLNGNFSSVVDNQDYLHIVSHQGGAGTIDVISYLITAHTTTNLTLNVAVGSSGSISNANYYIPIGHNLAVGNASLKGAGFSQWGTNIINSTTGYPTPGAVQPQAGGGATGSNIRGGFQN